MATESRRQRRKIAKDLGYLGKSEDISNWRERVDRSIRMGKSFHVQNLETQYNKNEKNKRDKLIQDAINSAKISNEEEFKYDPSILLSGAPKPSEDLNSSEGPTSSSTI